MKRENLLIMLIIGFVPFCYSIRPDPDAINRKLMVKSSVQYVKEYEYLYKFGEVNISSAFLTNLKTFNKKGLLIEEKVFNRSPDSREDNEIVSYLYDPKDKLIKIITKNQKGVIQSLIKCLYKDTIETERQSYNSSGSLLWRTKYNYDSLGVIVGFDSYDKFGQIDSKTMYKYDRSGDIVQVYQYDEVGAIESIDSIYNINDNKVERLTYNEYMILKNRITVIYNDLGQELDYTSYEPDAHLITKYSRKNKYKNNMLIEYVCSYNDVPDKMFKIIYNKFEKPTTNK